MFSIAVSVGTRLNAWKMKPSRSRRSRVSWCSLAVVMSSSPIVTDPPVETVESGHAVHERRFARARGAHDGGELAGGEVDVDSVEGEHPRVADAVDLRGAAS